MDIAKVIIDYRARHNLSQKAFAELVGLHFNTIYSIEAGEKPRATTVSKIQQLIDKE